MSLLRAQEPRKVHAVDIVFGAAAPGSTKSASGKRDAAVLEACSSSSRTNRKSQDQPPASRKRRSPVSRQCSSVATAEASHVASVHARLQHLYPGSLGPWGSRFLLDCSGTKAVHSRSRRGPPTQRPADQFRTGAAHTGAARFFRRHADR